MSILCLSVVMDDTTIKIPIEVTAFGDLGSMAMIVEVVSATVEEATLVEV